MQRKRRHNRPADKSINAGSNRRSRKETKMYYAELVINGLLVGALYAMVALGFVLIYKASDILNFAQGEFVMIAAIVVAGMATNYGFPLIAAIAVGLVFMIVFNLALERFVLRPMIGRPIVARTAAASSRPCSRAASTVRRGAGF